MSEGAFERPLEDRILVLDGAMGTMIQRYRLSGGGFSRRAVRRIIRKDLRGNNDLLVLTPPA